ncbi:MAG: TatD family hydrolase [Clostridia bacterium]
MDNISLFDSHAHLDDPKFDADRDEIITSLKAKNVTNVINIGANIETSIDSVKLANKYPFIYAAIGVHPYDTNIITTADIETLKELALNKKVVAIGEIGLDYHMEELNKEEQKKWFIEQLNLASSLSLPVIIHDRDAHFDTLDIIKKHYSGKGVFHCFAGSVEMAQELIKMGFYLSFTGVCTFKNAKTVKEVIKIVPLDKFLIETDCPYLSPEPFRGTRNSPLNVYRIAETIALIKDISYEDVCKYSFDNTKRLFNIDDI